MVKINPIEEYLKFVEMLVKVTATDLPLMDFTHKEQEYNENLQLIRTLLLDDSYSSLLNSTDWQKILNFVGDCRYSMPNITTERFLECNQMIAQINENIVNSVELEETAVYIGEIAQTLKYVWSPKKKKLLKQEQQKFCKVLFDHYHSVYMESAFIDEMPINGYVNYLELSKSLVNEDILLSLLCNSDVNVDGILYLIQSPLTPYAMTRILNFLELEEDEILLFESITQAANEYIKTGKTMIQIYGYIYKIQISERNNDYSDILESNSYERLTGYLHQMAYQEQKKLEKR